MNAIIQTFEVFDKELIKKSIIDHLTANPSDFLEHLKDMSTKDQKKFYGKTEIINFYELNPKTKVPSRIVIRNGKQYYNPLN